MDTTCSGRRRFDTQDTIVNSPESDTPDINTSRKGVEYTIEVGGMRHAGDQRGFDYQSYLMGDKVMRHACHQGGFDYQRYPQGRGERGVSPRNSSP